MPDKATLSIYGSDDRIEVYQLDQFWQEKAKSTGAFIYSRDILNFSEDQFQLRSRKYSEYNALCPEENFFNQPVVSFCSGSLVAPDLILTAGHCLSVQYQCDDTSFAFDYEFNSKTDDPKLINKSSIYKCHSVIEHVYNENEDYALIKLDRPVLNRPILPISSSLFKPAVFQTVTMIGHPAGLPKKISNGVVLKNDSPHYFEANLDAFGGNSGSAVFNSQSGQIEGILVRGWGDFEIDKSRNCNKAVVFPEFPQDAEQVQKVANVAKFVENYNGSSSHLCSLSVNGQTSAMVSGDQLLSVSWSQFPHISGLKGFWHGSNGYDQIRTEAVDNLSSGQWKLRNQIGMSGSYLRWIEFRGANNEFICSTNKVTVEFINVPAECALSSEHEVILRETTNQLRVTGRGYNSENVKVLWSAYRDGKLVYDRVDFGKTSNDGFQFYNDGSIVGSYSAWVEVFSSEDALICKTQTSRFIVQ